jgi:hypothetical protein
MAQDARRDEEDGGVMSTLRRIGIKIPNLEVKGNKAAVKPKRYDVSTEAKIKHKPQKVKFKRGGK